ncbi:SHOCT domain-containing protein [Halorubrum sp. CGM4_25_10-8A]|uniref:SHOCT domain-containing protein n=1 Tax=Halorubrum sp. CGM4_25_10-8A TaxID=2518116 RepID=UPI0010F8A444|nr:SHOCT domain-containing protein [Halorubrum sp. CGM4_25_10-8A]TKX38083.1 SHOCT domain-containing protein [Halorubrum sp. CGM4_25_10-8A]
MYELVHRYAPQSPAGRTAIAIIGGLLGVPAFVLGLIGLSGNVAAGLLFLLVSTVILGISGQLTLGVVRQANASPASSPQNDQQIDEANETPIETLRRRYAEGEIDDEAFERRLDQLIETEEPEQRKTESERVLE